MSPASRIQSTWPPDVPNDWDVKPLRRICKLVNGSTPKSGVPDYWDGSIAWATPDDLGDLRGDTLRATRRTITEEGYRSCGTSLSPAGSLVLSTRAPIGHVAIAGVPLCTNQGCRTLVLRNADSERFFYYQLVAAKPELESWGQGSTFKELSRDRLAAFYLAVPPVDEQLAIVRLLDRETARIDALIEKKQRQIELLREKRVALISHAVTKGLDATAPMKDSGIEWLGRIPEHWEAVRLKRCIEFITSGPRGWAEFFSDTGEQFIRIGNLDRDSIDLDLSEIQHVVPPLGAEAVRTHVGTGDILVSITADLGSVAVVPETVESAYISQHIALARPKGPMNHSRWLGYSVFSECCKGQLRALGYGGTKIQLSLEDVQNLLLCLPPGEEQRQIVSWLDKEVLRHSAIISRVRESIDRLREHRTALISAAVTGKIDVCQEVA